MARRFDLRISTLLRPSDPLADDHAQRSIERDAERVAVAGARTLRYRSIHHARGARQLTLLGRPIGYTGTDGDK